MSPGKRIFLNVAATYGRCLYALVVGLFCGRWALMSLGEVDFGLFGLVGGLTAFVVFFNDLFASSVGRFYAYAVGREKLAEGRANDECRKWFNTAFTLHATLSVCLVAIGYPVGVWAVGHFLAIPADRVAACMWVWRFACLSCFASMSLIPFKAMYVAKQEIAEMTVYDVMSTTLKAIVLGYIVTHPGDWLAAYAFWMMVVAVAPQVVIAGRALVKYHECKFVRRYLWDWGRTKEIAVYAFARFWSSFAGVVSSQGIAITVNKYLGAAFNSSMSVGGQVAGMSSTLGGSLSGAFWPAIANKAGEGDEDEKRHGERTARHPRERVGEALQPAGGRESADEHKHAHEERRRIPVEPAHQVARREPVRTQVVPEKPGEAECHGERPREPAELGIDERGKRQAENERSEHRGRDP